MERVSTFLRCLACIFAILFTGNALAAGYTCDSYKKYTSCASGYYMVANSTSTTCNTTAVAGNRCIACSNAGANYTCSGGTACPKLNSVTCSAGQYLPANATSCSSCKAGYKCPSTSKTYNVSSSDQGLTACSGATEYQDATGATSCKSVSTGYYKNGNTAQAQCPSGYRVGAGASSQNDCVGEFSKSGSQLACSTPSNCASVTCGTCAPGTCTYKKNYKGTITADCTPSNCTKPVSSVTANAKYYVNGTSCSSCPTGYPNSDSGNSGGITKCYSGTKSRAWTGTQTACSAPSGCATVQCNSCSNSACDYVAYANTAGTGDGTIKSGCSTNNAACQQTVKSVTAKANYYVSGTTCPTCSSFNASYTKSDGGNISSAYCYKDGTKTGSQLDPALPTGCATRTTSACTPGTCTYKDYYSATDTTCTPTNCTKSQTCTSASANYFLDSGTAKHCNTIASGGYPKSDGGNITSANCYKDGTKTGSQVNGSTPSGCASVTAWNSCTPGTCTYKDYYTATDGTCTPSNCTKTPKTVTANAGYFASATATSCTACPSGGTSAAGATANTQCYKTCSAISISNGKTTVVNAKENYNGTAYPACTYNVDCNAGYGAAGNKTTNPTCTQCTAGNYSAGGTATCAACGVGTYSSTDGASSCSACSGATQYQNETGKTSCKTVDTGYYKTNNSGQDQCPAGSYCTEGTKTACPTGKFTNVKGQTSCTSCTGSTYQDSTGQTSCKSCPTAESGWTLGTGTGWTAVTSCFETQTPANCASGTIQKKATSTTAWGTASVTTTLSANKKYYVNGTSCSACPSSYPESAGGAISDSSCYIVKTETGTCTNAAIPNGCKTVSAYNNATPTTCTWNSYKNGDGTKCTPAACTNTVKSVTAKSGYYTSGATCPACATGYTSTDGNTGTTASGTCYISVAAGKYLTTANATTTASCANWTYKAAHNVYQGSTSTCDSCPSVTTGWNKKDSTGTGWGSESSCVQTQKPSGCVSGTIKQVASSGKWGASAVDTALSANNNYYVSGTSCPACSTFNTSYPKSDGGAIDSGSCYKEVTLTGKQNDPATLTGCSVRTLTDCTPSTCKYKDYYSATDTPCTPADCTKTQTCTSASTNYYLDNGVAKACSSYSSTYTSSDGGAIGSGKCYVKQTVKGTCTDAAKPDGCSSATYSAGTQTSCEWKNYADNSANACVPAACTNPVATVTASANHYANGLTCPACPDSGLSAAGATAVTQCYKTCSALTITGGTTTPVNAQEKYNSTSKSYPACTFNVKCDAKYGASGNGTTSPSCKICGAGEYSNGGTATCATCTNKPANSSYTGNSNANNCAWTCNSAYGKTFDNACVALCTAGISTLHAGDKVSVQLYDTKHTTPAIVIQNGDKMCYGNLAAGSGTNALNVTYKDATYHTVN